MRLYLLDCGSLCRWMYESRKSEHAGMLIALDEWIDNFVERLAPTHALACFDAGDSGRKAIDPAYKAKRPAPDPDYVEQLRAASGVLESHGIAWAKIAPYEADDLIASAVVAHSDDVECIIVSEDKDLFALVGDNVQQYAPRRGLFFNEAAVTTAMVEPRRIVDMLALAGDASDGVVGIDGIGRETAIKAIRQTKSMSELFWLAEVGSLSGIAKSRQRKMVNGFSQYEHAMRLVSLITDVSIEKNIEVLRIKQRIAA